METVEKIWLVTLLGLVVAVLVASIWVIASLGGKAGCKGSTTTLVTVASTTTVTHTIAKVPEGVTPSCWYSGIAFTNKSCYVFVEHLLSLAAQEAKSVAVAPKYPVELRIARLAEWMSRRLCHLDDPYVRVKGSVTHGVLELPNETIASGGGGSDDLALLAYGVLEATKRQYEHFFYVAALRGDEVHAIVLGVFFEPRGGKSYHVFDPATLYFEGVMVRARLGGTLVNPMDLCGDAKDLLRVAKIVYIDSSGYEHGTVTVQTYYDAYEAIATWLDRLPARPEKYIVFDQHSCHVFRYADELAEWLQKLSLQDIGAG
jgi:hypothetical protein